MLMSWQETTEHTHVFLMVQGFRNDLSFLSRPQNFFLLLWSSWYCLQMTISLKWKKYGVWMQEFILCFRYLLFSIGRSNYRYHTAEKAHFLSSSSSLSSARMAPKSPNPRLKSNPRICYPLFTPWSKDSWSFLIPSFNIFAIRQNCMQLCPTVICQTDIFFHPKLFLRHTTSKAFR